MTNEKKLSDYSRFSGCGAKLGPALLDKALCTLSQPSRPEVLADFHGSEDAGVYRLRDDLALVQTIDFFPPVSEDPFRFGQIAAANALSDIYAMGGRPITAVSVVCFPEEELDISWLRRIMEGGLDKLEEADTALLGGHSVSDRELKFGFSVNGVLHPDRALRNNTPVPGDRLILTKALGTGAVNTARKAGMASPAAVEAAEASMAALNRRGAEILGAFPLSALTDVTGFGLAGHAAEMVQENAVDIRLFPSALPLLPEAREYIALGLVPEGTYKNREHRLPFLANASALPAELTDLLFDPQTSGGLLAALPREAAEEAARQLEAEGLCGAVIGEVVPGKGMIWADA